MKPGFSLCLLLFAGAVWSAAVVTAANPSAAGSSNDDEWNRFAQTYCIECHGPEKQKGKLRLDQIVPSTLDNQRYATWKHVKSQLEKGEMPPDDAKHQPTEAETLAIRSLISTSVRTAEAAGRLKRDEVPLKRLNRTQYRNTLRDLLGIETTMCDPTRGFPDDRGGASFDVVADDLKVSDTLMEHYLRASSQMVDAVTCGDAKPERLYRQYIDKTNRYRLQGGIEGESIGHEIYNHYDIDRGYWVTPQECGHVSLIGGTPFTASGTYRLTFKVESLWRDRADITKNLRYYSPARPHQLALRLLSPEGTFPEVEHTIAIHDLPDNQIVDIEHDVWIPKDWRLQLYFENGPACPRWVLHQELVGWHEIPIPGNATPAEIEAIKKKNFEGNEMNKDGKFTTSKTKEFMRTAISPRIRLHKMAIDGPLYDSWPPASHTSLYSSKDNREVIRTFSKRAFRRTVSDAELEPFVHLADTEGCSAAIKAMLCSPSFLYIYENEGSLDNDALACRLSYALTNSMPDGELLHLAATRKLTEPAVFTQQIDRLLASPNLDEFIDSFVSQWLRLRNVDKMPPDQKKFPAFYRISHGYTGTRDAIVKEPVLYFKHLLSNNLSASFLVDADFTIAHDSLADFYGIPAVNSSAFQMVRLDPGQKRGGLLGMAAVLAASANGVDTSPVVRGIYVLDNLLGRPPEPPPPGIKLPDPDIRGTTTIRNLLEKHSTDDSCAGCHKSIDPLGFALENFDAIGHWRKAYPNGAIDASGKFPSGKAFADVASFKKELGRDLDAVAENLIRKLLVYCTGRRMGPLDDDEIAEICTKLKPGGYRLRDALKAVVTSRIFLTK